MEHDAACTGKKRSEPLPSLNLRQELRKIEHISMLQRKHCYVESAIQQRIEAKDRRE